MIYCIAKENFFTRGNKAENPISPARLANQNTGFTVSYPLVELRPDNKPGDH